MKPSSLIIFIPSFVKSRVDSILKSQSKKFRNATYDKAYYLAHIILTEQDQEGYTSYDFFKYLSVTGYLKKGSPQGSFGTKFYKEVFLPLASDLPGTAVAKANSNSKKGDFEKAVFQSNGHYSKDDKVTLLYRINPKLINQKLVKIELNSIRTGGNLSKIYSSQVKHFHKTANELHLDLEALKSNQSVEISPMALFKEKRGLDDEKIEIYTVVRNFNEMYLYQDFPIPIITYSKFRINNVLRKLKNEVSLGYILKVCSNHNLEHDANCSLIIDNDTVHIQNPDAFVKFKKELLFDDIEKKIYRIKNKMFFASVAASNGRLHSDFTSFNNIALKYFKHDGNFLSSLDLKTSQPCILANLLNKNEAFIKALSKAKHPNLKKHLGVFLKFEPGEAINFPELLRLIVEEDLYSKMAETLKQEDEEADSSFYRNKAKLEMMRILFAKPGYNSQLINIDLVVPGFKKLLKSLKEHFIAAFKDDKNHFNLFLQLVESYIFVERIYQKCIDINMPSFTKHDSIIFPRLSDTFLEEEMVCVNTKKVGELIYSVFDEIAFEGELSLSNHFYINTNNERYVGFESSIELPSKTLYSRFNQNKTYVRRKNIDVSVTNRN